MAAPKLTPKQEAFVREYLVDLNSSAAARRAGYAKANANVTGPRLLANVGITQHIEAAKQKRAAKVEITAERVLMELGRIAFFDLRKLYREDGSMKAMNELDTESAAVLAGVEVTEEFDGYGKDRTLIGYTKKAKVPDKVAALALAMRHLGMLKDKTEITGSLDLGGLAAKMRQKRVT